MFKKILVGVDSSESANDALNMAIKLAHQFESELHIFHAIKHHYEPSYIQIPFVGLTQPKPSLDLGQLQKHYVEAGKQVIENAKRRVEEAGLTAVYHLEQMISPADFAKKFVEENDVDLIVVGCKGHHSKIRNLVIGSVADKVLRSVPCEVLIVR